LRPKAKLISFISKMMITLRMRSSGLHPHTRIVVASDLIVVVIADAAWHHRPGRPPVLQPGRRVRSGSGGSALASWLRELMPSVVNTFRKW